MNITRRTFIHDLGKGTVAALVITGCATETTTTTQRTPPSSALSAATAPPNAASTPSTSTGPGPTALADDGLTWTRVDLGFVSAYVLARSGEVAIVDTGVAGSEDAIEATLNTIGLGWEAVGHVIVTHEHPDHAGSLRPVLERAIDAVGYAAAPDIDKLQTPRPLSPVVDGDSVFGLQIVATPGHTAGHISVLDPGRFLIVGDALNNTSGLSGANSQFSTDIALAVESAKLLGSLEYEAALFGHGVPIESGAAGMVAALAASL